MLIADPLISLPWRHVVVNQEHLQILKQGVHLWNEWREQHRDITPDLRGADLNNEALSYADFAGANLRDANLSEADLTDADLRHASLYHVNLNGALLIRAQLNNADVRGGDHDGAFFIGADLRGAVFSGSINNDADFSHALLHRVLFINVSLRGANFYEAETFYTVFVEADLRDAKNLDKVKYSASSEISSGTIYRSEGKLPEVFLRGCGLKDWEIEATKFYRPDLARTQIVEILYRMNEMLADPLIQFYSCFISYSHADIAFARRLHDELQKRGIRCWLDKHQIVPGQDIYEEVDRGIRLWDKVLLCCSKDSLTSWWVDDEITKAYEKEQVLMSDRGEKVLALIPLNLDGYLLSGGWRSGKASQIKSRLASDFTGWDTDSQKFGEEFERLMKALRTDGGRERPPQPKL
jgi:uncharacterized protein YjbI with pentapeptide repeats